MPTARKDVADYINRHALKAAKLLVKTTECSREDTPHQTQVHAAIAILKKVVPDIKATELTGELIVKQQEFVIGGEDDTSQA